MYTAFETLQGMGNCGVVWIYFSGHGLPSGSRAGALARGAVQSFELKAGRHHSGGSLQMQGGSLQMEAGGQILQSHLLQLASQLPGAQTLMVSATLWSSLQSSWWCYRCWIVAGSDRSGATRPKCESGARHMRCIELYSRPTDELRVYRMARHADM